MQPQHQKITFEQHETMKRTGDHIKALILSSKYSMSATHTTSEIPTETSVEALQGNTPDIALPDFVHLNSVKWPQAMVCAREEMHAVCSIFLLEDISRVAMVIDNKVLLWNYITGADFKVLEESDDYIVNISVVLPRKGVFKPYVSHLLVVSTRTNMTIFGLSFPLETSTHHTDACTILHLDFTVRLPASVVKIAQHRSTRRFFVACTDGDLYELCYDSNDSSPTPTIRLVNLTMWFGQSNILGVAVGHVVTSFMKTVQGQHRITDVVVDSTRHVICVLQSNNTITLYQMGKDGHGAVKLYASAVHSEKHLRRFVEQELVEITPLVSLHVASPGETYLVFALASNGDRFYYAVSDEYGFSGSSPRFTVRDVARYQVPVRRRQSQSVLDRQVTTCFSSSNVAVIVRGAVEGGNHLAYTSDEIAFLTMSHIVLLSDGFANVHGAGERKRPTVTFLNDRSGMHDMKVNACAEINPELLSPLSALPSVAGGSDVASQCLLPPRRFVLVTRTGVSFVSKLRPVDVLHSILASGDGTRHGSAMLGAFKAAYGKDEYCYMLLLLGGGGGGNVEIYATPAGRSSAVIPARDSFSPITPQRRLTYGSTNAATPLPPLTPGRTPGGRADPSPAQHHGVDVARRALELLKPMCEPSLPVNIPPGQGGLITEGGIEVRRAKLVIGDIVRGCRLLVSRLLKPLFETPIFRRDPAAKDTRIEGTTLSPQQLDEYAVKLQVGVTMFEELRRDGWLACEYSRHFEWESIEADEAVLRLSPGAPSFAKQDAINIQAVQLSCLSRLLSDAIQLLKLLRILQPFSTNEIFQIWRAEYTHNANGSSGWNDLSSTVFENILLGTDFAPQQFTRSLMRCVVKLSTSGRGDFNSLCEQLQRECGGSGGIVSNVDLSEYSAQLALEELRQIAVRTGKLPSAAEANRVLPNLLPIAVHLFQSNGLAAVCHTLAELKAYYAVASLCFHAAHHLDPNSNALQAYLYRVKPKHTAAPTQQSQYLLQSRWKCYNTLGAILGEVRDERILMAVLGAGSGSVWHIGAACDELAQYFLFEWMLSQSHSEQLRDKFVLTVVNLSSQYERHVENFLEWRKGTFGRELAKLYMRNGRYDEAILAYLHAVDQPFENADRVMDQRLKILTEALSDIESNHNEKKKPNPMLVAKVEERYYLAEIQRELLSVCERFAASDFSVLESSTIETVDNRKISAKERVAEDREKLTASLLHDVHALYAMAEVYKRVGGAVVQLRVLYRLPMSSLENQKLVCSLAEEALLSSDSPVEVTACTLIKLFYDSTGVRFFPLSLVVSVLECAAFNKNPAGDNWTSRVLLQTNSVGHFTLFNTFKSIYASQFLLRKPPLPDDTSSIVFRKFSDVTKEFFLFSICSLVLLWAQTPEVSSAALPPHYRNNQVKMALSDCEGFLRDAMGPSEGGLASRQGGDGGPLESLLEAASHVLSQAKRALDPYQGSSPVPRISARFI